MWKRRLADLFGMLFIGDAVVALIQPRRHVRAWTGGSGRYRRAMDYMADNTRLTRALGAAELAAGVALIRLEA